MKKYSLLFLLAIGVMSTNAQETEKIGDAHASNFKSWAVGVSFGQFITNGDLQTFQPNTANGYEFEYGLGLSVTKYLSSVWGIKGQFTYGNLSGSNRTDQVTFVSEPYFDYNLNGVLNISALALKGKQTDRKFALLASAGVGMSQSVAARSVNGTLVAQYADVDTNKYTNEFFMPADLTLKYRVADALDIDAGVQVKYFFSDIIDGLPSGSGNDVVIYPHIGLTLNLGKKEAKSVIYTNPLDDMYFDVAEVKSNFDQLTTDDDKDGVNNYFDKDNSTPEGVVVDGSGRALDVDQDGIPDNMDEDPFTAKGAQVDAQGRAVDSDGDGVADYMDEESNTPEGTFVNFKGQTVPTGMGGAYMPSVYFNFNSATITAANYERLATIARAMKANENAKIVVTGYADARGSEEYNKNLGMRRAEAVKKQLNQVFGIDEGRIETKSEGETAPLATGRYDINRRADITVK